MTDRPNDRKLPGAVLAQLLGASKTYGTGATAVHAVGTVDLQVRAGELLAVLGPNGAGKTTALGMLTGLTAPTSGTARLFGRDPRDLVARQRMGVMLQSSGVPDTLRVRELLTAFRGYYPAPLPVASIVRAAGLDGLEGRLFGTLSGGQQRRVLFGIALCGDPELVFVDEPTTGLDAEVRRTLWATLRDLASSGRGVVLTTHYLEEADALADRIVVLHEGRVIAEGSPSQIKSRVPGRRVTAESSIGAEQASGWPGVHHAQRDGTRLELLVSEPEPVLRELLHRDRSVTGVTVTEPTLEDAFLTLTARTEEAA
jgi:ABC-2 type transport system ATP-binding protein